MDLRARISGLRLSYSIKLFAIFTLLTAFITFLVTTIYISNEINEQRDAYREKARILATNLAENARLPLYAENSELLRSLIREAMSAPDIHNVVISAANGKVLAQIYRQKQVDGSNLISSTVEVHSAPHGESVESALTDSNSNPGALIGSVLLQLAPAGLPTLARNTTIMASGFALGYWLMVAMIAYAGLRKATHSFHALMNGIETMRAGDFAYRIDVGDDDEPGRAAQAVNELAASLQERDLENARLHEELVYALRLEVQEEKKQLMAKLIQANRMTSLGLLASSMAHEINNPNGAIRLANRFLSRSYQDALPLLQRIAEEEGDFSLGGLPYSKAAMEITERFSSIERSTERIANVIQDLRSYSLGVGSEFVNNVDIKEVISGALTIVRSHGKYSGMTLESNASDNIPLITGSRHQLEQVLINLLLNAIQATPEGKGQVAIHSCYDQNNGQVCVSIKDNGIGIPPENLKHLTEPFFSTRIDCGGSGLGLFVTNFIVSAHNGQLQFSSTPGAGATVMVRLPVHPPANSHV